MAERAEAEERRGEEREPFVAGQTDMGKSQFKAIAYLIYIIYYTHCVWSQITREAVGGCGWNTSGGEAESRAWKFPKWKFPKVEK